MAATGWRYCAWDDAGSPASPGIYSYPAGSLIPVMDYILTVGDYPWTKVINSTNNVTYTAPAGSMIAWNVDNNTAMNTNNLVNTRANLAGGSPVGALFPTTTQQSSQGRVCAKTRTNPSTGATYDMEWYAIRTDRFFIIWTGAAGTAQGGYVWAAGDVPVFDGADPGLCVILGSTTTTASTTSSGDYNSPIEELSTAWSSGLCMGYASVGSDGITHSAPCFPVPTLPSERLGSVSDHLGHIPLGREYIATSNTTTATILGQANLRGYLPYFFIIPVTSGLTHGDTFSDAGGATYIYLDKNTGVPIALMTSNSENLP